MLLALHYCHHSYKGIRHTLLHRDLKPENGELTLSLSVTWLSVHVPFRSQHQHLGIQLIPACLFVTVLLSGAGQVKLADFGLAKVMANGLTVTTSFVGVGLP